MSVIEAPVPASQKRGRQAGGRRCYVCDHPQRANVESAVLAGRSMLATAKDFHISRSSVARHMKRHAKRDVASAVAERNGDAGTTLLARIQASHDDLRRILKRAEGTNELTVAVNAIQGGLRALELEGRLTGEISSAGVHINVALGVRMDVAQRRVQLVGDAESYDARAVAQRAADVLRAWNAECGESERIEVRVGDTLRVSESEVVG